MASASSESQLIRNEGDDNGINCEESDSNLPKENDRNGRNLNILDEFQKNRDIGDVPERPTSLRLESVLEYTNRIKTFLGLQDEEVESLPPDAKSTDEDVENNSEKQTDVEEIFPIRNNTESSETETEDLNPKNDELSPSDVIPQPLPDIIGIQPDSLDEFEHEQFPDILLERGKSAKIENDEAVSEINSPKNEEKINFDFINSGNNYDVQDLKENLTTDEIPLQNKIVGEEEPLVKAENICDTISADIVNLDAADNEKGVAQSNMNNFTDRTFEEFKTLEEEPIQISNSNALGKILNEEGLTEEDEKPYQITHIEEGLRQAEKNFKTTSSKVSKLEDTYSKEGFPQSEVEQKEVEDLHELQTMHNDSSEEPNEQQPLLTNDSQDQDEQQAMRADSSNNTDGEKHDASTESNPPILVKRRSKLSMEDIRRLSTEVVNSVLQTAGDEVKVILRNRDSVTEENKPSETNDAESLENQELVLPLQDTEQEYHGGKLELINLSDIPEEKPSRTFSNTTNISRESIATSGTATSGIRSVPVGSKHSIDRIEVTDEIDVDNQCGIGPFKPQFLQRYATANTYVVLYSIIGILHGSYYTYLVGVLTTLEKRFEFKSKTSGFIMMLDELTPLFLGVLVGHFGGRAHRPRMLSFGMFLSAFCCFASALPYFLYGTATHLSSIVDVHNQTSVEMCNGDVRVEHCDDDDRPPTMTAILLLMLGSFLKGFGNLAYYAIGLAYLDDNAKKRNTPLYFAVAFALRLLGPMVGFLMSSAFLKYYENPFETPDFGPDDPRWIGGWWMGFMLQGFLLLIFAGPMALFPRWLPDHRPLMHEIDRSSNVKMFDGLGESMKRLVRNPLFMLIGLNAIFTVYGNFGFYIMLPKYMENQFRLSASSASLFAGPPGIAALMVSCILGGYLIWRFKPSVKLLAGGLVTLEVISTVGYLILMIPQCEKIEMTHFGVSDESLILENACNVNCSCSTVQFTPVCGPDGKSYFSPCYAGCSSQKGQSFYNCSCLNENVLANAVVTKGLCTSENCWSQALAYIVTLPVLQFIVNILRVAYTMILLRSIKPEDKNIALGSFETVLSTVAFIPFPMLYGALVDSACLVWEKSCGETGNCWFYDIQKFNYLMHGGSAFFCGLSTLNLIAIFFLVDRIKDLYKDEESDTAK